MKLLLLIAIFVFLLGSSLSAILLLVHWLTGNQWSLPAMVSPAVVSFLILAVVTWFDKRAYDAKARHRR